MSDKDLHRTAGRITEVRPFSTVDGPGIRTTVFFKGCNLRCAWCHNPETQSFDRELMLRPERCVGCGLCRRVCPNGLKSCDLCGACAEYCAARARSLCGEDTTAGEIFDRIEADRNFYDASGGGATFSGGECLLQPVFLEALLTLCKGAGISTAVDTAGNVGRDVIERIEPLTDLFLFDFKCFSDSLHLEGTGKGNVLIKDNLAFLAAKRPEKLTVRIPLIPGFNDSDAELGAMSRFLGELGVMDAEVLPCHTMGNEKYAALNRESPRFGSCSEERAEEVRKRYFQN
ncbi:MAG: glycyl-radical enzyme activating protein [Clostridia bacterium]|nr:glycyl-radical enzyme activating protein [Clostridia bacterium]